MNVSVGLVSATSFRVPSAGVLETFGRGSLTLPTPSGPSAGDDSSSSGHPKPVHYTDHIISSISSVHAERAAAILCQEDALTSLHRVWCPPAQRPTVPLVRALDEEAIRRRRSDLAREGVRWFEVQNRRKARQAASQLAEHEIDEAVAANEAWAVSEEHRLDTWWDALCGNDPAVVTDHLSTVFRDSGTPAKVMALTGDLLDVAVLIPGEHVLPTNSVHLVDGQLSIRRASRAHRAQLHRQMVAGLIIATTRRALAAAPGLGCVRVHALHATHRGRHDDLSMIAIAELSRHHLAVADLAHDPETLLLRYASGLRWVTHSSDGPLRPLLLEDAPELADLLASVCRSAFAEENEPVVRAVRAPA